MKRGYGRPACDHAADAAHLFRRSSSDVQPNQLSRASRRNENDPPISLAVQHDGPGYFRFDRHGTVN